ncbi:MAG: exonuclease domain-containing protein [Gammaproteobacteria bacterium]
MNRYCAFDTETTGIQPGSRMLEIAAQVFLEDGSVERQWATLVNPGMPIPPDVVEINGITDEMVKDAPTAAQALEMFLAFAPADALLVAHNASYDIGIIEWEAQRAGAVLPGFAFIDTCEMARRAAKTKNARLDTLVEHFAIERLGDSHRALCDADAARQLYLRLRQAIQPWTTAWADAVKYHYAMELPEVIADLPALVAAGGDLSFAYEDGKGDRSERTIVPYGWANTETGLMFHGLCKLRGERRTFRGDRVLARA